MKYISTLAAKRKIFTASILLCTIIIFPSSLSALSTAKLEQQQLINDFFTRWIDPLFATSSHHTVRRPIPPSWVLQMREKKNLTSISLLSPGKALQNNISAENVGFLGHFGENTFGASNALSETFKTSGIFEWFQNIARLFRHLFGWQ